MARKRYIPEQIIRQLRHSEVLTLGSENVTKYVTK